MTLENNDVHFLVRAKKILRTNEWLPILNHFYNQKTQAFMDNNFDKLQYNSTCNLEDDYDLDI